MADNDNTPNGAWTFDVQRGLAWTIVLLFAFIVSVMASRVVWSADVGDINDILKSALAVLFNIVMLILGFFFGSSKSSQTKDDTQAKVAEKLAERVAAPIVPVEPPTTVVTTAPAEPSVTATITTVTHEEPKP